MVHLLVLMVKKIIISKRAHFYDIGLNIALIYKHGPTCLIGSMCMCAGVFLKVIHYGMHVSLQKIVL